MRARSVSDVILGEATYGSAEKRYEDMRAIASAIVNRANALGVPLESVVQNSNEFNAYNKPLPPGASAYRSLADQALVDVMQNGPVHSATFYATPSATRNLPKGLLEETRTGGHVFFSDPMGRAIGTSQGYRKPNALASQQASLLGGVDIPTPSAAPRGILEAIGNPTPQPIGREIGTPQYSNMAAKAVQKGPDLAPTFDAERFGPAPSTLGFDSGRFGSPAAATPKSSLSDALNRQAVELAQQKTMPGLADQYKQYGMGQATMQNAMAAKNLELDVADQRAKLGLEPMSQTLGYVDPMVTTTAAPAAAAQPQTYTPQPPAQSYAPSQGGLLAEAPVGQSMTLEDANRMSRALSTRQMIGGILGGVLGGGLLGPLGALGGGYLGRQAAAKTYYPEKPKGSSSEGISKASLNERGRDTYERSGQFRDAVNSGRGGLY